MPVVMLFSVRSTAITLAFGCIAASLGCRPAAQTEGPPVPKLQPTREAVVLTVQPQRWSSIIRSQGVLVADEVASVGTKVAGSVAKFHVELGDFVRAGQPLVELDQAEFQLQVEQAEAQLAQARSAIGLKPEQPLESLLPQNSPPVRQEKALWDAARASLQRAKQSQAQNAITPAEFDQNVANERVAEARHAGALNAVQEKIALISVREAELALARVRLGNAVVVAPFDGLVQQRLVAPGDYVQVGDHIASFVRTDPLRFRGNVPEHHAQSLVVGQEVRLQIEGIAEQHAVQVTRISPSLEQASRSLLFEAELPNGKQRLRAGLFAQAEVVVNPQAVALVVPHSAVVEFAGAEKVWKVVDGMAREQEVLTGQRRSSGIEILSGLTAGDVILGDGSQGSVALIKPLLGPNELDASQQRPEEPKHRAPEPGNETPPISTLSGSADLTTPSRRK